MSTGPPATLPQYVKIANDLREKIRNGTYGPGALLPSRNEITALYGVSAITARDALALISHEGLAKAIRGRGHIVRRKRPRRTLPARLYNAAGPDGDVPLQLQRLDIYQETAPDNIALPLEADDTPVWVRRAVYTAIEDHQPIQIHVSWLTGLTGTAEHDIRSIDPDVTWPQAVQAITGRAITSVLQNTRARRANPFEADALGLPDATIVFVSHLTTYDAHDHPIEHSRYTWPIETVRIS
ncbi:MAG TPA: GntR family transcriptional regulator, partial [Streptosporangiaceae bacterium]|nr:GntR family transcriptional regulator [Streptosporangiaceae bacterium]